jgi:hypothetical protein
MTGINSHNYVFGTDADPDIITLGPKLGTNPDYPPYFGKYGMEFEVEHAAPILAPIDMVFIGFKNRNARYRIQSGEKQAPFNDLMLCFESTSPDWPGMIVVVYHLYSTPLLLGHNVHPDCGECEEWGDSYQAQGRLFFDTNEQNVAENNEANACEALIGYTVKRGELIGYAGSVGDHSMASLCFKVLHTLENPTVTKGNRYLHWVQPGSFFYWKCFDPEADFPDGVLTYPFQCEHYKLPVEQQDTNFKYATPEND